MGEKVSQIQVSPEVEDEIKKVMKDVILYLENWCNCSETALFSRAIELLKKLGLLEEFKKEHSLPKTLYGIRSFLYDFLEFLKEKMPELYEEIEEEVYAEEDEEGEDEEDGGVEREENKEEGNDIDIEVLETIKRGISEFSKRLIEKASSFSEFRTDMIRTAIALMQGKYRIQNPEDLKGLKKSDIRTILFVHNCFEGTKAIIKTKKGEDRIISIKTIEDEEVKRLTELMKAQYETLQKRFNEEKEELKKEIERKEKEIKEIKEMTINHLIEKEDTEGLKKLLYFYGTEDDIKYTLEKAKEEGKDVYWIAKKIASAIEPELVAYALYQINKEKAEAFLSDYGINIEEFKKEFELEA